jgi:hypothetical protein
MKLRTKRAKVVVQEEGANFIFDLPMPSELEEINDRHTAGLDADGEKVTDNREVIKELWCKHLASWNGVDDEEKIPLTCDAETRVATWMADTALCIKIVNEAFRMVKGREDLAEKN